VTTRLVAKYTVVGMQISLPIREPRNRPAGPSFLLDSLTYPR